MIRSDEEIKVDIIDQLEWDDRVDASDISATVDNGVVSLRGSVPTWLTRSAAYADAWAVDGVIDVQNALRIEPPRVNSPEDDAELKRHAEMILGFHPDVDERRASAEVEDGVVTLSGSVDAYWKKLNAEEAVSNIGGVVDIRNNLTVVPRQTALDETIAGQVEAALRRRPLVEAQDIDVQVEGGVVRLSGEVATWAARRSARDAALHTPGVVDVRDRIRIRPPVVT
ncbi:MAG: BON domain-containing protein [Planctomycetota bacterium]|nr:BON domain-containing protein [Planctomycetota bacterium]